LYRTRWVCGAIFVAWGGLLLEKEKWPTTAMITMCLLFVAPLFECGWCAGFLCTRNDLKTAPTYLGRYLTVGTYLLPTYYLPTVCGITTYHTALIRSI
jgi:hypothetical protein